MDGSVYQMNRNCSAGNRKIDEKIYLKHRTICKKCHNENRRKNINNTVINNVTVTTPQQPKIDIFKNKNTIVSNYDNHACVVIGPRNVGKTYYILKILGKIGDKRPIKHEARSHNQYPVYKASNEIISMNKNKSSVVIFDDMLGARNCSQIDEFFTRGRHEDSDVYYISQRDFALPRQALEKIVIDCYCLNKHSEMFKVCIMTLGLLI